MYRDAGIYRQALRSSQTWASMNLMRFKAPQLAFMFAALMIGDHFSISARWKARRASGVC